MKLRSFQYRTSWNSCVHFVVVDDVSLSLPWSLLPSFRGERDVIVASIASFDWCLCTNFSAREIEPERKMGRWRTNENENVLYHICIDMKWDHVVFRTVRNAAVYSFIDQIPELTQRLFMWCFSRFVSLFCFLPGMTSIWECVCVCTNQRVNEQTNEYDNIKNKENW